MALHDKRTARTGELLALSVHLHLPQSEHMLLHPLQDVIHKYIKECTANPEFFSKVRFEVLQGDQLTDKDIRTLAENYREYFGFDYYGAWGEYLKCSYPSCSSTQSIQEVYKLPHGLYLPLSLLERNGVPEIHCSQHPDHAMVCFHDVEKLTANFQRKIQHNSDSVVSLLRNLDNEIVGYGTLYKSSLWDAWNNEFDDIHGPVKEEYMVSLADFLGYPVHEDSPVCVLNLIGINLPYRNTKNTQQLLMLIRNQAPKDWMDLPILYEMDVYTPFAAVLMTIGATIIHEGNSISSGFRSQLVAHSSAGSLHQNSGRYYSGDPQMISNLQEILRKQKEGLF